MWHMWFICNRVSFKAVEISVRVVGFLSGGGIQAVAGGGGWVTLRG